MLIMSDTPKKEKTVFVDGKYSVVENTFGSFDVRYNGSTMSGGYKTKAAAQAWLKANKIPEAPKPTAPKT